MAKQFGGASAGGQKHLKFPMELGTDNVPNYICFRAQKVNFGSIDTYGNNFQKTGSFGQNSNNGALNGLNFNFGPLQLNLQNPVSAIVNNFANSIDGIVNNIANRVDSVFGKLTGGMGSLRLNTSLSNSLNLLTRTVSGRLDLNSSTLQTGITQQRNTLTNEAGIYLFMPNELGSKIDAVYSTSALGQLASGTAEILGHIDAAFDDSGKEDIAGAAVNSLVTAITSATTQAFAEGPIRGALALHKGRVTNNFTYAIFDRVDHREFSYSFKMVAKSEEESQEIKKICDQFMYYMLPEKSDSQFHFFEIPCQWTIEYFRMGKKIDFIDQPKPSFLKSCDITYGKDGLGHTYNNGAPVDVTIKLNFVEIEPMYRSGTGGGGR